MKHKYNLSSFTKWGSHFPSGIGASKIFFFVFCFFVSNLIKNEAKSQTITLQEDLPIHCHGANDGSIQASTTLTGSVTYDINNGTTYSNTTGNFDMLGPGNYTICATNGTQTLCDTITLIEPDPLFISMMADPAISCDSVLNGGILLGGVTANISGGVVGPLAYSTVWTNAAGDTLNPLNQPGGNYDVTISDVPPGIYKIHIEDYLYCMLEATYSLNSICLHLDQEISCNRAQDGSIQAFTTLSGPLLYDLDGAGSWTNTTGFFDNLDTGTHTICVAKGTDTICSSMTIFEPDPLAMTFVIDSAATCSGNHGQITVVVTGGTLGPLPFYYTTWTTMAGDTLNPIPNNYDATISGLSAGAYGLHIEDFHYCLLKDTAYLPSAFCLVIDQPISCNRSHDGSVQANASMPGTIHFDLDHAGTWLNTNGFFNGLDTGTHSVCVTNGIDTLCSTVYLSEPAPLTISYVTDILVGCSGNNGQLSAVITGGTIGPVPGYATVWTNPSGDTLNPYPNNYDLTISGLSSGNYGLHIEDYHFCTLDDTTYLGNLCLFVDQNVSCKDSADGTVQASTTSPGTWMYNIDGGLFNNPSGLFLGLDSGMHYICANNGSTTYCDSVLITEPDYLTATFTIDSLVSCHGLDGQISVTPAGGTVGPGFLTVWTNAAGDTLNDQLTDNYAQTISSLAAGNYFLRIEDDHACVIHVDTTLLASPPIIVNASSTAIACSGGTSTISATSTGGDTYYAHTYEIGTTSLPAAFPAGTYTIVATDARGCTGTTSITITQPAGVNFSLHSDSLPGCTPTEYGGLTAVITGGSGIYNTVWTNSSNTVLNGPLPSTVTSIGGLVSDTYSLTVTDQNGCSLTKSYYMPTLCLFVDQNVSCKDSADGTVQASSNLSGSLMYGIDGGALTNPSGLFLDLDSGLHTICVSNDLGVTTYCDIVYISEPDYLTATFTLNSLVSCQGSDGEITVNVQGGTMGALPFFLTVWTNSAGDTLNDQLSDNYAQTITALPVGNYFVRIEDDHACVIHADTTMFAYGPIVVTASSTAVACTGGNSTISATSTGGSNLLPHTYTIGTTVLPASFPAGTYTVVATDASGCTGTTSITIVQPVPINITLQSDSLPGCTPTEYGGLSAIITGGTGVYQTIWVNSANTVLNNPLPSTLTSIGGLVSDTYSVTVTDQNGCSLTKSYYMPTLCLFVDQNVSCKDSADGTVQASTNLIGTAMYGVDGGPLTNPSGLFLDLDSGNHTICVSTDLGVHTYCDIVYISEPDYLTATFSIDSLVSCHGDDGQISVTPLGGTVGPGFLTVWTNAAGDTLNDQLTDNYAQTIGGLAAGNYFLRIEDDHACVIHVDTTLLASPPITVSASSTPILCYNGMSTVSASSTGGDSYSPHVLTIGTSVLPASFPAGTYTVVATDARGCTGTTSITISQPAQMASNFADTSCNNYYWIETNVTYTVSGAYQAVLIADNGCDSIVTLNLIINNSTSSTSTVYAANAYMWGANGVTYTNSGTFTHTLANANSFGCDSNLTLNLHLIPLTLFVDQNVSCKDSADGTVQASTTAPGSWLFGVDGAFPSNPSGLFLDLDSGLHTICAYDGVNTYCDTVSISEPDYLTATITIDSLVSCLGNDGQISVTPNGGTVGPGFLTVWTNASGDTLNDQLTNNYAQTLSGLSVGSYFIRIEDDHACVIHVDTVLGLAPPLVVSASATAILCYGGSATVSATSVAGFQPATYAIGSTALPASFPAGTYTVTGTDTKGCTSTTVITLTQPPYLPISQTETACDSFLWLVNNQTYTTTGTYTATFTSVNGCDSSYQLNLTVNYSSSFTRVEVVCDSFAWLKPLGSGETYTMTGVYTSTSLNASNCIHTEILDLTVNYSSSHTTPVTVCDSYTWLGPLGDGATYTLTGIHTHNSLNASGCLHTETLDLTVNYSTSHTTLDTACNSYTWIGPLGNGATYTISGVHTHTTLNSSGCVHTETLDLTIHYSSSSVENVTAANAYTWVANGVTYTNSGTYTHTLLNSVGCDSNLTLNLAIIRINVIVDQHVSCNGNNDGSVQANATGGSGSFTYDIDGGTAFTNTSGFFIGLAPGVHTVCAKESLSNVLVCDTVTITQSSSLSVVLTVDATVSCLGNDGGITASVTGGVNVLQPYLMTWSAGVTTTGFYDTTVTGLTAGTYTVVVEDDNLCFATASITVGLTPPVVVTATNTAIVCYGGTSVVTPSATGGTGAKTFAISGGSFTVTAGTYTITATDTKGCTGTTEITITQPVQYAFSNTETACDSYTWSQNSQVYTISGTYVTTYLSVNGCDSNYTLHLTIKYSSSSVENITAANTYTWVANGVTYTNSGTATHTLVNSVGCDSNLTLNLAIIRINVIVDQHVSCNGNNDGSVQANATGASGSFTYDIDGGTAFTNTSGFFIGLAPGVHTVCAKESLSNVLVCDTVTITQASSLSVVLTVDATVSCLGNDGGITASVTGGVNVLQPYLMTWSAGVPTTSLYDTTVTGLTAGTYTVVVEDDNLCFATASITVGLTPPVVVTATNTAIVCNGGTSVVTPTATGGTGTITFAITGGSFTVNAGTYTITATDTKGCTGTTVITITQPAYLLINESHTVCNTYTWPVNSQVYNTSGTYTESFISMNGCDSIHTLNLVVNYLSTSVENITAANSYTWVANGVTYTNSGTYTHTLVGGNSVGCDSNLTLNLSILNINIIVDQNVSCHGNNDGSVEATANGGSNNFTYDLDGANLYTNTTGVFSLLTPGTHTICAKESPSNVIVCGTVVITEPAALSVILTVDSTVSCLGNDGGITATITGGTSISQNYLTLWYNGVTTNSLYDTTVTGLSVGTYTVIVEDDNLCFDTASITVGLTPVVSLSVTSTAIACYGGTSVIIPASSGGTGLITHTITGGSFIVQAGTYTVTATDRKGCTSVSVITITQPALITSTQNVTATGSYTWSANNVTYTVTGVYTITLMNIAGCDSVATLNLLIGGITIAPKLYLMGPYVVADGMMHDSLRSQNLIPNNEPYTNPPYNKPSILDSNPADKFVSSAILGVTGPDAIVDWVFVELRSGTNPSTILATRRALLQRDGDVVSSVDGISPLFFPQNTPGNYYVSVKHRNHLGIMTASALPLVLAPTTIDFTTLAPVYVHIAAPPINNPPRKTLGSVSLLWAGDANANKNTKYNGLANDKEAILLTVSGGSTTIALLNNTVFGYRIEDVNMDGMVRYNNADNDKNYILNNVTGVATPNAIVSQHTPN